MIPTNFRGSARTLTLVERERTATFLGCELAAVDAVLAVEARGKGFDSTKRPVILFEPHVFWRELPADKRSTARAKGLAYPKWGEKPYARSQDARYRQLEMAMEIDRDAALKSASWGLGQVMGFNHKAAGFPTVEGMVQAMCQGEYEQLMAMAQFIKSKGLDAHLRALAWGPFAKGYNGAGYRKNQYDVRLAKAYAKAKTGNKSRPTVTDPMADGVLRQGEKGPAVEALQNKLVQLGFDVGGVDGDYGALTAQAVQEFQAKMKLAADGVAGPKTLAAIETALVPAAAPVKPAPEPVVEKPVEKPIEEPATVKPVLDPVQEDQVVVSKAAVAGIIALITTAIASVGALVNELWGLFQ